MQRAHFTVHCVYVTNKVPLSYLASAETLFTLASFQPQSCFSGSRVAGWGIVYIKTMVSMCALLWSWWNICAITILDLFFVILTFISDVKVETWS